MLNYLLYLGSAVLVLPLAVLGLQIFNSLRKENLCQTLTESDCFTYTILIPAHNEAEIIAETLNSIKGQLSGKGNLIVIADNCSDNTEQIVRGLGVEAVSRSDLTNQGKGFALGFGIQHIGNLEEKPDALIILDADCLVSAGKISNLAAKSIELNRPVQGLYLMHSKKTAGIGQKVAEFAWLVKNKVRPLGYKRLNFLCQLMGSGMAFPWSLVDADMFSSANIVEDLELGIKYTIEGHPPFFHPAVTVSSFFPLDAKGQKSQRMRWEHGHLATLVNLVPRLLKYGLKKRNIDGVALAADLLVPPLSLLAILLLILNSICMVYATTNGDTVPLIVSLLLLVLFNVEVLVAWRYFGRDILRLGELLYIPVYIVKKIPLYLAILVKRQMQWVKTSRKSQGTPDD